MVILEKFRKKVLVTTFGCRLKRKMGTILHLNRTSPRSHLNRTKEEAEGTAARRC
jgi:hypothetical protein